MQKELTFRPILVALLAIFPFLTLARAEVQPTEVQKQLKLVRDQVDVAEKKRQAALLAQEEKLKALATNGSYPPPIDISEGFVPQDFSDRNNLSNLESSIENQSYQQAERTINKWQSDTKNEEIEKLLPPLLVAIQAEAQRRVKIATKKIDELLIKVKGELPTATDPEKLEAIKQEFQKFTDEEFHNYAPEIQPQRERINRAENFLTRWREFIVAESDGDIRQALRYLKNMRTRGGYEGLITSKELADRYAALVQKQVGSSGVKKQDEPQQGIATNSPASGAESLDVTTLAGIMASLKTPDDVKEAAGKLSLLKDTGGDNNPLVRSIGIELGEITRMQKELMDGAYPMVLVGNEYLNRTPSQYDDQLLALRNKIKIQAVEKAFHLKDLGEPRPGVGFPRFIYEAAEAAFEKQQWERLSSLLMIYSKSVGGCGHSESMNDGVRAYLAGQQLEKVGLYRFALQQYANCIGQSGSLVPHDQAVSAVERLRKEHPEVFQ